MSHVVIVFAATGDMDLRLSICSPFKNAAVQAFLFRGGQPQSDKMGKGYQVLLYERAHVVESRVRHVIKHAFMYLLATSMVWGDDVLGAY